MITHTNDPQDLYFTIRVNEQFFCRAAIDIFVGGSKDNRSPSRRVIELFAEGIISMIFQITCLISNQSRGILCCMTETVGGMSLERQKGIFTHNLVR